ncbi:four-carbon acid sugar kinase family protein [Paracoccus tegillarcae]|uniref:Four-carbon acid sugar kinase family protein n=1 Tax=Paracoccus tegillarcae TaxID=1529068 RepID=A0A2K9ERB9_9RHOB|nr:four-carbon acid sugar kinase family protein [Paracoccus tegillarcae]AUH33316.1 hypothetical protein CUV01_07860 [Paracoccus tegillarcae]
MSKRANRILIVADDLTGALDSGCAFAARGYPTRVLLDPADLPESLANPAIPVIAIATGTRELSSSQAAGLVSLIAGMARRFDGVIFKKVDSRLKGHVSAELAALCARFRRPVLAAPAIPRLDRLVVNGCVTGAGVAQPIPVADAIGLPAHIPDTASDADLDLALPADLRDMMYVGAAGLAEALARRLPPGPRPPQIALPLPALLAIGSRDPVTLTQIDMSGLQPVPAPNGQVPDLATAPLTLVQMTSGDHPITGAVAGQNFATGIAGQIQRSRPASLFACGGETAHAILRKLDIRALNLLGEVLPGLPVSRSLNGNLTLLTKSGGFGGPDTLARLADKFVKS